LCHAISVSFKGIVCRGDSQFRMAVVIAGLLDYVGEFMSNEFLSGAAARIKTSRFENKLMTHRVSQGIHGSGRRGSPLVRMYAHPAEVVPKLWFKK